MLRFLIRFLFGRSRYEHRIVTGTSFVNVDEASQEAERKVTSLTADGWEAIAIGCGGRATGGTATGLPAGGGEGGVGGVGISGRPDVEVVDVVVLLRREL